MNHKHDSKAESNYCDQLGRDKNVIEIIDQPKVYMTLAKILYKPDFHVTTKDSTYYVDVKGMRTAVFQIKMRLWKKYGPVGSRLMIVSGNKTQLVFGPEAI